MHAKFTNRDALLLMVITNLGIVFIGILAETVKLPEWLMLVIYLLLFASCRLSLWHVWRIGSWVRKIQVSNDMK